MCKNKYNAHTEPLLKATYKKLKIYLREGASKRISHSMPNFTNLLPADIRLKINSLDLKQFVSLCKSITIASYDANCMLPWCYLCGNNWGICDYWLLVCMMRARLAACTRACASMCLYSECTCVMHAQLTVSVSSHMPTIWLFFSHIHTYDVLSIFHCICTCVNMLPFFV